ncbi:MAG TPA: helix-turn-helix domain-containing protein [Cytophagales bacterium]|nr:helix-turn-helix domain-containing protein [Cytophagales bacterium]
MPDSSLVENDFLNQITSHVENNISNEQFGVSELAEQMNMSRSNLLRKVKKLTKLSVSQLIRQVRLKRGLEMLRTTSLNVSEVSQQVGFTSVSYFIKCFREYYGYSPGEVGKRDLTEINTITDPPVRRRSFLITGVVGVIIVLMVGILVYIYLPSSQPLEKSIAVLPFKNDSNDSTNIYLINGIMESTLNNLQKIKDLKVISRTSAEKYRNKSKSIPEMAKELNVNYFVEGSGQKIGDRILLNIQLIEAASDKHLWSKQYRREVKNIFELQEEISKNIAEEVKAIITPEEKKRIEKKPTDNLLAYDYYLKGRDLSYKGGHENLEKAILFYKKAIAEDNEFGLAYADAGIAFYYLDIFQKEKKHVDELNEFADKALLFDSKLANSLVAKAMFYMNKKEYPSAVPYLEKALEYNPNSALVINFLSDLYSNYIPNTGKYLQYALKGARLDVASQDSTTTSYNYLHLSNALMQTGFLDEALKYINKSLDYNPENPYSEWVKTFILVAKNDNLVQARERLLKVFKKDTTRLEILQDVAKICYSMRDYKSAYHYYKRFIHLRDTFNLDIYKHEHLRIAIVLSKMGYEEESKEYLESFKSFADSYNSIYKHLFLSSYYSYKGDAAKAIEHLKLFSKEDNYIYWVILYDEDDPMISKIKDLPEFKKTMKVIETKFWKTHNEIREMLEEEELL